MRETCLNLLTSFMCSGVSNYQDNLDFLQFSNDGLLFISKNFPLWHEYLINGMVSPHFCCSLGGWFSSVQNSAPLEIYKIVSNSFSINFVISPIS